VGPRPQAPVLLPIISDPIGCHRTASRAAPRAPARRTTLPDRAGAHAEQLAHTPRLAHAPFPSIHFFALGNFSTQASPRTAPSPLRQGRGNSLAPRFSLVPLTRAHLKPQQPSPNWPLRRLGIFSPLLLLRCHVKGRRERGGEGGGRKEGRRVTTASSCRSRSTRSWSRTSREEGRPRARKNRSRGARARSSSPRCRRRDLHQCGLHCYVFISAPS
jgi:hypothetical protein